MWIIFNRDFKTYQKRSSGRWVLRKACLINFIVKTVSLTYIEKNPFSIQLKLKFYVFKTLIYKICIKTLIIAKQCAEYKRVLMVFLNTAFPLWLQSYPIGSTKNRTKCISVLIRYFEHVYITSKKFSQNFEGQNLQDANFIVMNGKLILQMAIGHSWICTARFFYSIRTLSVSTPLSTYCWSARLLLSAYLHA